MISVDRDALVRNTKPTWWPAQMTPHTWLIVTDSPTTEVPVICYGGDCTWKVLGII